MGYPVSFDTKRFSPYPLSGGLPERLKLCSLCSVAVGIVSVNGTQEHPCGGANPDLMEMADEGGALRTIIREHHSLPHSEFATSPTIETHL